MILIHHNSDGFFLKKEYICKMEEKEESSSFLEKLKNRWGLKHNWEIIVILIIFSLAGQSIMLLRWLLWWLFNLEPIHFGYKVLIWILVLFPLYHVCFMFWGFVLRQWKFTWWFEKKMLSRFGFKFKS